MFWLENTSYKLKQYEFEKDLEDTILEVQGELFGPNRIYMPIKKKIGKKGGIRNIPDGYLLDLQGSAPRLYVVENELASHDPLRHVAVQLLEFSLSFEAERQKVKNILREAISDRPQSKKRCEEYAKANGFRNIDYLLDNMVHEGEFSALVIIDDLAETLEQVLVEKFNFAVEVVSIAKYENDAGQVCYHFEPFLADVMTNDEAKTTDIAELDTIVVPARDEGFENVFIGEDRWYKIRIHSSMRPQIKFIAVYQVAPTSAITHFAPVESIELWKESNKYVVNFSEPATPIGPIELVKKGRVKAIQHSRYTTREKLLNAKTLDDIW